MATAVWCTNFVNMGKAPKEEIKLGTVRCAASTSLFENLKVVKRVSNEVWSLGWNPRQWIDLVFLQADGKGGAARIVAAATCQDFVAAACNQLGLTVPLTSAQKVVGVAAIAAAIISLAALASSKKPKCECRHAMKGGFCTLIIRPCFSSTS